MPRSDLDSTVFAYLDGTATNPAYFVKWKHNGSTVEYLGTGSAMSVIDLSATVEAEAVDVVGFSGDGSAVSLRVPATPARVGQVQDGTWRGQICEVWLNTDSISDASYDAIRIFYGVIDASSYDGGFVNVTARQNTTIGRSTPVSAYADCCNHLPVPGEVVSFSGNTVIIEQEVKAVPTVLRFDSAGRPFAFRIDDRRLSIKPLITFPLSD